MRLHHDTGNATQAMVWIQRDRRLPVGQIRPSVVRDDGCSLSRCRGIVGIPYPSYNTWNVGISFTYKVFTLGLRYSVRRSPHRQALGGPDRDEQSKVIFSSGMS